MSTNDVPGVNPDNNDELHGGCWAEHKDGSLLYVQGTEQGKVVYELFDMSKKDHPVEFRDAMIQKEFERQFTWNPKNSKSIKWTWHDKLPFPWHQILDQFEAGVKPVSADRQLSAADAVRKSRQKYTEAHTHSDINELVETVIDAVAETLSDALLDDSEEDSAPLSVAATVAQKRSLKPKVIEHADVAHRAQRTFPKGSIADRMRNRIQSAIDKLKPGRGE